MFTGKDVFNLLEEEGIKYLHHANTSSTALSFLENGAILSRQYVEDNAETCWQTIQGTDELDKQLGIFNDVFFDVENLWECGPHMNNYGPVVFKFSTKVLKERVIGIMKDNPIRGGEGGLYFERLGEVKNACIYMNSWQFSNHIVVKDAGGSIDLASLKRVIFYSPNEPLALDSRNNPSDACCLIKQKSLEMGIKFENRFVDTNCIPEKKYPTFYGFMMKVPKL